VPTLFNLTGLRVFLLELMPHFGFLVFSTLKSFTWACLYLVWVYFFMSAFTPENIESRGFSVLGEQLSSIKTSEFYCTSPSILLWNSHKSLKSLLGMISPNSYVFLYINCMIFLLKRPLMFRSLVIANSLSRYNITEGASTESE
jgi:hypothetical protein